MKEVQELVGIVPWTFVAQICNLFLTVFLVKKFLFDRINKVVEERKQMADSQIADATKAKEEAKSMRDQYEASTAAFQQMKSEIGDIAVSIAGKVIEKEVKEADHQKLIDEFISDVGEAS